MYCLKRFPTLSILNQHIAEHDADETPKQFSCLKCDKKFTTKYNLQYHERVHTGEKPFNCALCNKSFKSPSGLTYHMENHKRSPFTCSHCDKLFESEDKLKSLLMEYGTVMVGMHVNKAIRSYASGVFDDCKYVLCVHISYAAIN